MTKTLIDILTAGSAIYLIWIIILVVLFSGLLGSKRR